jgi:hypothetical protein
MNRKRYASEAEWEFARTVLTRCSKGSTRSTVW